MHYNTKNNHPNRALLLGMPDIVYPFGREVKVPVLGLESIAANVDSHLADVKIANLALVNNGIRGSLKDYLKELIDEYNPGFVGLSSMTFQYPTAVKIAKLLKQMNPEIRTVLGGYHASLEYMNIAGSPDGVCFDFIVRGEGEDTFPALLREAQDNDDYNSIPGLSYNIDGKFYHNPNNGLTDLGKLKIPDRGAELLTKFHALGIPITLVETSRGCNNGCEFCCIREMYGHKFRTYDVERVIDDIKDAKTRGNKLIYIVDDNITLNKSSMKRLEELCEAIIDNGLNDMKYAVQASVKGIANYEETVRLMKKAGFTMVFLGIESPSQKTLDLHSKGYNEELTKKAVGNLKKNKIIAWGGYIVGNPDDKEEDLWAVYDSTMKLKLDILTMSFLTPFPGTKTRERLQKEGLITCNDWSKYTLNHANIRTRHLSSEELEKLLYKIKRRFYMSPIRFLGNQALHQFPEFAVKFLAKSLLRFFQRQDDSWYSYIPKI